ncbi:MAG TPA: PhoPQ-activated protein PqaA family protein [bacterium]|nr:PhoPQ-activated pathogenicity-like protein PqaA type [Candidatus Omnitrophota bacterium]HOJ62110.1 PhoPQ-activated protein PqaA family protein [bacterium]HPO99287.1 PhoPQ-activated protein PqaA family protein [bacterium]
MGFFWRLGWKSACAGMAVLACVLTPAVLAGDPEGALRRYLDREENVYQWSLHAEQETKDAKVYDLRLVSQTWQNIVWTHQLRIVVPGKRGDSGLALLFITGGSNKDGEPNWNTKLDDEAGLIGQIASRSGSPVAVLHQVPNQPLYDGKVEDDLISHTFLQYFETRDETWPLLLPMVKSAVKAMNAVQEFCQRELNWSIRQFVVSGGSKRGWTTWLTGAGDQRVAGIAPMVIDILNMSKQMDYQLQNWGEYSEQIDDYTRKGIQQRMNDPEGIDLRKIVDPYSYISQLTLPKMLFMGTNDPYWSVDAVKLYWDDLLGEKSIHYVPNVGHGLGDGKQAVNNLAQFFGTFVKGEQRPQLTWSYGMQDGKIVLKADGGESAKRATFWWTTSGDLDFRNNLWLSRNCRDREGTAFVVQGDLPKKGYAAVYLQVFFPGPLGDDYSLCTRIHVLNTKGFIDAQ